MIMLVIAHGGRTDTVKESALKDTARKIPYRTLEFNLPQRRAGPTLYQLSYILTPIVGCSEVAVQYRGLW